MSDHEPLGPIEAVVVAFLVDPLGYRVAGIEVSASWMAWWERWTTATEIAYYGRVALRRVRHQLDRQVELGHAECAEMPSLVASLQVGEQMSLPAWRYDAPMYRWRADVDPSLYDAVEFVSA